MTTQTNGAPARRWVALVAAACTLGSLAIAPVAMADEATSDAPASGTEAVTQETQQAPVQSPAPQTPSNDQTQTAEKTVAKIGATEYTSLADAFKAAKDGDTVTLTAAAANQSVTIKDTTAKFTVTAEQGVTFTNSMRINANNITVTGMSFKLDSTKDAPAQSLIVSSKAQSVNINNNTFTIPAGATAEQLSCVWLEQGATGTSISDNTFNLGQTNNSSVGINLVGNKDNVITGTKVERNTVNAGPLGTNLEDPSSLMFVVGNGNTSAGSYGISGLTVSDNKVYNKTNKAAVESKIYGVSVTATQGTVVTGNYFEGFASVGYSGWPDQGPNDDITVTSNTFNTYTGLVMGSFVTDGGMTLSDNKAGKNLVTMVNASSPSTSVADPNGKTYSSIAKALEAGVSTITLLKDVTENVTISGNQTVTLDLNGHTLTNKVEKDEASDHTITNNGTLTIKDSVGGGVVDNVSHQKAALFNTEGAKATLNGGTFKRSQEKGDVVLQNGKWTDQPNGNTYYTIQNQGDLTINDGTSVQLLREGVKDHEKDIAGNSSVIANGWYDGKPSKDGYQAKLTINGDTITGGKYLKNDSYGELVVNGGTIRGRRAAVLNYNVATINGGTFSTQDDSTPVIWNYPFQTNEKGALTVTGGSFTATGSQQALAQSAVNGATSKGGISISGGFFEGPIKIAQGTKSPQISGGKFTIGGKPNEAVKEYLVSDVVIDNNGTVNPPAPAPAPSEPTISGIEIVARPSKTVYRIGEAFDPAGLKVNMKWSSGKKDALKPAQYEVTGFDSSKPGKVTVTVKLAWDESKTATFQVLVMFKDVTEATPHSEEIKTLLERDITRGFDDGTFRGMGSLNRQDLAAFLYRMAGQPDYTPAKEDFVFADVTEATPHYREILWAAKHGVVKGYDMADGTRRYEGDSPILRQDLAAMLWQLAGAPEAEGSSFADVTEATPHAQAIVWAKQAGVAQGFPDGGFHPGDTIVRQDAAAFLGRVIAKDLVKF